MIFTENLKMIANKLKTLDSNIPIFTKDITENIPRPSFHIAQEASSANLLSRGGEIQVESQYKITYFADRKYVSALNMQLVLIELLSRYVEGETYYLYPSALDFAVYPDEGVLEATFTTKQLHTIGSGTEESAAELMQQLILNEQIENERNEA